jgi:ParB family chromosome partitioning protein
MIGQGLNSLIPPKDPQQQAQSAAAVNTPASQGQAPVQSVQSHPPVTGVIHADPEQIRADEHAAIALEALRVAEYPKGPISPLTQQVRQDIANDVAYRPLGNEEYEVIKRAAGFSKRTAIGDAIFHIEVEKIKPNPYQPRKHFDEDALRDLANSIREFGILQPLVVSKIETETENGTHVEYQLIAGERRLMASKRAGLERVPVIIRQAAERAEQLELAIIENLQREDLDTIETARSYARLQDEFGMTQREVAARLGKSREVIGNALRLLSLPVEIQDALAHNQINESQARLLLSIPNVTVQKQLFADLLTKNFSVRELKAKIKNIHNPPELRERPVFGGQQTEDLETRDLQNRLKDVLGTDVKIERRGESGKIVISFYSPEELYGVVKRINPRQE